MRLSEKEVEKKIDGKIDKKPSYEKYPEGMKIVREAIEAQGQKVEELLEDDENNEVEINS